MVNSLVFIQRFLRHFSPFSIALLLAVFIIPSNPNLLMAQQWWGVMFFSLIIGIQVGVQLKSIPVALAVSYFLGVSAATWSSRVDIPYWAKAEAASGALLFLTLVVSLPQLPASARRGVANALGLLCLISSIVLIGHRALGHQVAYFFMNNAAADACLIAVLLPFCAYRSSFPLPAAPWARLALLALPFVAIAVSGSSSAVVAVCCTMLVYHWRSLRTWSPRLRNTLLGFTLVAAFLLAGLWRFTPDEPFNNNGRVKVWRDSFAFISRTMSPESLERFRQRVNVPNLFYFDRTVSLYTGAGTGSFWPLHEPIQDSNLQSRQSMFPFAHNDWFQVLFEQGLIGLLLMLAVGLHAAYKALARPWLLASLLTYGAIMFVQFPFRYFGGALIGAFLLVEALAGDEHE